MHLKFVDDTNNTLTHLRSIHIQCTVITAGARLEMIFHCRRQVSVFCLSVFWYSHYGTLKTLSTRVQWCHILIHFIPRALSQFREISKHMPGRWRELAVLGVIQQQAAPPPPLNCPNIFSTGTEYSNTFFINPS